MQELNQVFLDRMRDILGEEYDDFISSLSDPSVKSIYVNENKISVDRFKDIVDFSISPILYERSGFYIDDIKLGRHPLHHAGAFYIQEPSAMFTINAHSFRGDEIVLDLCSAPGGKSIQIANRIPNGILVSNEIVKARSAMLYSNIERMGLKNVIITNDSPENLCNAYANTFDVCVVDAPCSGEGMFRKGSDMISAWNPNLNTMCAARQMEILDSADIALKQGGYLIYSTCTYSLEENEGVVRDFLAKYDYELVNIEADMTRGVSMPEVVRLYPHKVRGEGQCVAVLKKKSCNENLPKKNMKLQQSSISRKFIEDLGISPNEVVEHDGYAYNVLDTNMIKSRVNYVSIGVRLGSLNNHRFDPHHYLFTAFGKEMRSKISLDYTDERVVKYLRGETFEVDMIDGYGAILVNDCAVGGYKISQGKFKNFYPKGLRNF